MSIFADKLGFDSLWISEHHTGEDICPNPLVLASSISQKTKRIRIGTGVIILPLYKIRSVAEQISMVDNISDGRLEVGVGKGFDANELKTYGIRQRISNSELITRSIRLREMLKHIENPETFQKPFPRIWIASNDIRTCHEIGLKKFRLLAGNLRIENYYLRKLFESYSEGLGEETTDLMIKREVLVINKSFRKNGYDMNKNSIIGTKTECLKAIKEDLKETGSNFILISMPDECKLKEKINTMKIMNRWIKPRL